MLKSKLSKLTLSLALLVAPLLAAASLAPAFAADPTDICSLPNVSDEIKASAGCSDSTPKLQDVVTSIVNGVIAVVGFVAVCFVVYGGILYMTSAGDSAKTTKGRNTIFYALIGIAICALSFVIVNFVLINLIQGSGGGSGSGEAGVELVGNGDGELTAYVGSIVKGVIAVLGFVCVIVMIFGGTNYMASGGDSAKVQKAKNTILYGLIGLIICVLAFAIVNLVIVNIIQGT